MNQDALGRGGFQTPDDAYRFACGEAIGLSPVGDDGQPTRTTHLDRPIDFAAVTDHSEWLGEVAVCTPIQRRRHTTKPSVGVCGPVSHRRIAPLGRNNGVLAVAGLPSAATTALDVAMAW